MWNKTFFSALLVLLPAILLAQEPADSLAAPVTTTDTLPKEPFRLEGIRLGLDLSRLVGNAVDSEGRYYELNSDFSFGRYMLSADVGTGRQNRITEDLSYRTSGTYFRIGPDVNFIADSEEDNAIFLGARYGWCNFEEQISTIYSNDVWGAFPFNQERRTRAHWFEAVAGLKARVWRNFFLGYTMRLKFGLNVNDDNSFTAYEVPGFGKVGDGDTFSFNYHVFYRIPIR